MTPWFEFRCCAVLRRETILWKVARVSPSPFRHGHLRPTAPTRHETGALKSQLELTSLPLGRLTW